MRHVLVVSRDPGLAERLRKAEPLSTAVTSARDADEAIERLGRSSRVDAVVTDEPDVAEAVRAEIPGTLPVLAVPPGAAGDEVSRLVARELEGEPP